MICRRLVKGLLAFAPLAAVYGEEVLTERQVIIAPRRIEISPAAPRGTGPVTGGQTESAIVAQLPFPRGSMRLTAETRNALRRLRGSERKLRITGYGDATRANESLANLRARAVASFLEEYSGITNSEVLWKAEAFAEAGIGVTIEEKE